MTDRIRDKLEALISDSGMFNAGQVEERQRFAALLRFRIDELAHLPRHPSNAARTEELLNILQSLIHQSSHGEKD